MREGLSAEPPQGEKKTEAEAPKGDREIFLFGEWASWGVVSRGSLGLITIREGREKREEGSGEPDEGEGIASTQK